MTEEQNKKFLEDDMPFAFESFEVEDSDEQIERIARVRVRILHDDFGDEL